MPLRVPGAESAISHKHLRQLRFFCAIFSETNTLASGFFGPDHPGHHVTDAPRLNCTPMLYPGRRRPMTAATAVQIAASTTKKTVAAPALGFRFAYDQK